MNSIYTYVQIKYFDDNKIAHIAYLKDMSLIEFYEDRFGEVTILSTDSIFVPIN